MGTVMGIAGNKKISDNGVLDGMYHLYQSVEDLSNDSFSTKSCKSSLLSPRNLFQGTCMNFEVRLDDSSPDKHYSCSGCRSTSSHCNATCGCGGKFIDQKSLGSRQKTNDESRGVFLKGGMMFIVSDDLQVTLSSPSSLVQQLSNLGITDMSQVTEMSVKAGVEEISSLLKCLLISKSPLTDVFLVAAQGECTKPIMREPRYLAPSGCEAHKGASFCQLSVKLVLRKSTNRVLCAEASDDFVNFLFSFLTLPLGSVVKLLHGQTGLECIDNLHKSVENLESKWLCIKKNILLNAGARNTCLNPPLKYWEATCQLGVMETAVPAEERISGRFVKAPSLFLASDNLVVRDLSSMSCISFLRELNVPICDIEERLVTVGEAEALGILKASLTSSSALTNGLNTLLKKHKREE